MTNLIPAAISSQLDQTGEERIHAAPYEVIVRPVWAPPEITLVLFAAPDFQSYIAQSLDGGASFPTTVPTGISPDSSECMVDIANGRVFHWMESGSARTMEGLSGTWSPVTGLPFEGPSRILYTGTEYLAHTLGNVYASADGLSFSLRSTSNCRVPVKAGDTILGVSGGRFAGISTDNGLTFSEYSVAAAINSFEGIQRIVHDGTYFVLFANDASANLLVYRSTTGLSGTWSLLTSPSTSRCHGAVVNEAGDIVIVLRDGSTWVSDDSGDTWAPGPSCPYGAAPSYPTVQYNKMFYINNYSYFCAEQGSGVNRIYRWAIGELAWTPVYTSPASFATQSVVGAYL